MSYEKKSFATSDLAKLYETLPKVTVVNGGETKEVFRTIRMPLPTLQRVGKEAKSERHYALDTAKVFNRRKSDPKRIPRWTAVGLALPLGLVAALGVLAIGLWR